MKKVGLNPYPTAWSTLINNEDKIKVKLFNCKPIIEKHTLKPGTVVTSKNEIKVATIDGYIFIESLQLSGKRKMNTKDLLNGFKFDALAAMN